MMRRLAKSLAAALLASAAFSGAIAAPPVDPASYPRLDDKQMGHIRAIVTLAEQPDSDWSGMGSAEPGQGGFDAYRYQLAMMSYTLSLAHHRFTPAYRDLYRETDARLIHKMLLFDVWGFWELTSRGSKAFDPSLTVLGDGWIDPVKDQNIMYSGHLFQMVTTHEMLYGDARYSKPDAVTFVYDPFGRGLGRQDFKYDTHKLAQVLASQFEDNGWKGIECEPNAIFPECNQHPLLGFALYDRANGTDYFKRISKSFKEQFDALDYLDPKTSSFMMMYMIKQDKVIQRPTAWADGWSGSFMHAWYKPEVEQAYPTQRANLLVDLADGTTTTRSEGENRSYSHDHGFFALLAGEVGDTATRDRMLAYADRYWSPRWVDGALFYPRQDLFRRTDDGANVWRRVQPLTGNGLVGLARMNGKDGLYNLFNRPFDAAHFEQPYLTGIAYPDALVERAVYDEKAKALVATLKPGREGGAPIRWSVAKLDPRKSYGVWMDGRQIATIAPGKAVAAPGSSVSVGVADGVVTFTQPLAREASFVVAEDK